MISVDKTVDLRFNPFPKQSPKRNLIQSLLSEAPSSIEYGLEILFKALDQACRESLAPLHTSARALEPDVWTDQFTPSSNSQRPTATMKAVIAVFTLLGLSSAIQVPRRMEKRAVIVEIVTHTTWTVVNSPRPRLPKTRTQPGSLGLLPGQMP